MTYRDNVAIEWDKATMTPLREVGTMGEGWGLCWDGNRLIRSDGSARLHFHTTDDFSETDSIGITRDGAAVGRTERARMRRRPSVGQCLANR